MSSEFAGLIADQFYLLPEERELLLKTTRELNRRERKIFFQKIKPREKEIKNYLKFRLSVQQDKKWLEITGQSLIEHGGEPDLADTLVMKAMGRLHIYQYMREKSENEGIRLKPLANFGGLGMAMFLFMVIAALIIYFNAR